MDAHKADTFLMNNEKYLPADKMIYLKEKFRTMEDEKYLLISTVKMKDPSIALVVSILFGWLGVDRFMVGDVGLGILKLLTFGCFGIMYLMDWFLISNKVKENNFTQLMLML